MTKKKNLLILNFTIVSLFLFISQARAIEFDIILPEEITQDSPFNVKISSQESAENYDVKIFVDTHTKEFSEIFYNEKWQSPLRYLNDAYPNENTFKLISHVSGQREIIVRLRDSKEKISEKSLQVEILASSNKDSEDSKDNSADEEEKEEDLKEKNKENEQSDSPKEIYEEDTELVYQNLSLDYPLPEDRIILKNRIVAEKEKNKDNQNLSYILSATSIFLLFFIIFLLRKKQLILRNYDETD